MEFAVLSNAERGSQPSNPEPPTLGATSDHFGFMPNSSFRLKSSMYRGVQKIKDKETYVAHVYDNGRSPKDARTIYLGRFDNEEKAARAHDLVSLKFWGVTAQINFPVSEYDEALETIQNMTEHDVMAAVRRSSNSFSRGKSKYRGVVMHSSSGKWQARKGPGKESFLGTFDTEEEAAIAFDIASIKLRGFKAMTNFDIKTYNIPAILEGEIKVEQQERIENDHVLTVEGEPESSGVGNRRKKRNKALYQFIRIKKDDHSGQSNTAVENDVVPLEVGSESQEGILIPDLLEKLGIKSPSNEPNTSLNSSFKHSNSSAFQCYEQNESSESAIPNLLDKLGIGSSSYEPNTSLTLGFNHSDSSAFQCYKPNETWESSIPQEVSYLAPSFNYWISEIHSSYETELFKDQELEDLGTGFQHASSSAFKHYGEI